MKYKTLLTIPFVIFAILIFAMGKAFAIDKDISNVDSRGDSNLKYIKLEEAIEKAKLNNQNIKIEQIKLKTAKTLKYQAIAESLPNISANAQYGNRKNSYSGQNSDPSTKQEVKEIKFDQPLFDGFHSYQKYNEAGHKIESANYKTIDKIQEISFLAIEAYCNLIRYQRIVKLQAKNKELGEEFFKLNNRRKNSKIIDQSELIKFGYESSSSLEKYKNYVNKLNKAEANYKNIIGELDENLIEPAIPSEELDKESIISKIINNNNLKSYKHNYLSSKNAYNAEISKISPKVSLSASVSKQDKVFYLNNQDLTNKTIFINISAPIFQQGNEYINITKAKYEKESALEQYELMRREIEKEANQAVDDYKFLLDINKLNKKLFAMARELMIITRKKLASEVLDPIEAIRIEIENNLKEIEYINSQTDLIIIYHKIKYLLGEL